MLPAVLKNFSLFVDGRGYAGKCEELTLPKLTLKTEAFRGGGMDAEVEIDQGTEKLEFMATLAEISREVASLYGLTAGQVRLEARGAAADERGRVSAIRVAVRGIFKELDFGNWKAGEKGPLKFSVSCRYYRLSIDGRDVIEIDVENMIRKINGVDQLAAMRSALGR